MPLHLADELIDLVVCLCWLQKNYSIPPFLASRSVGATARRYPHSQQKPEQISVYVPHRTNLGLAASDVGSEILQYYWHSLL